MSIAGIGSRSTLGIQALVEMRNQLAELQRQLGSGKKADNYAGLGAERGLTVMLRSHLSALGGYGDAMTTVGVRLNLAQATLSRISDITGTFKSQTLLSPFELVGAGQTVAQKQARSELDEILGLLNTKVGDRYLFSGRSVDQPATDSLAHILDGDGARAGFSQVMAERNAADLGDGLGRLDIPPASGATVSISEEAAGLPFGLKLSSVNSQLTNATVSGPSGSPAAISIDLGAVNPQNGDAITFVFTLPDGSTENLVLTATNSASPAPGQYTIGANTDDTALNLQAALSASVGKLARTSLAAASAVAAANDFFNVDNANPPRRVDGPPFDTATALVAGTASDTVLWYTGEAGSDPARATSIARVDPSMAVSYGMRANEEALRAAVANIAVFSTMTFAANDPDAGGRYKALAQRTGAAVDGTPGTQKIEDIASALASAQTTIAAVKDRHQQTQNTLTDFLQQVEGVSQEEVAAKILALQTRLQASLQTTAMLYQTSLVDYL